NPPANGVVSLPLHVSAGVNDNSAVTHTRIYVDSALLLDNPDNGLNHYLTNLTAGPHTLIVEATDAAGRTFSKTRQFTVTDNGGLGNLRHIIVTLQENRSFDHYFGRMGDYRADRGFTDAFDGINTAIQLRDRGGDLVSPFHFQTVCHENLSPSWDESHYNVDGGRM